MTYTDLLQTYPQYTEWVVKTYEEAEDSCPRLQRLAKWLTRATDVTSPVVVAPAAKGLKLKLKGGGYATEPEHEMPQRNKVRFQLFDDQGRERTDGHDEEDDGHHEGDEGRDRRDPRDQRHTGRAASQEGEGDEVEGICPLEGLSHGAGPQSQLRGT